MTTIGSIPYAAVTHRFDPVDRSRSNTAFTDEVGSEAPLAAKPQSEKLSKLLADLEDLKDQELKMPISEYLFARFTLQEQISTERLNAGEDLDVIGIRFEGRVFQIAGKRLDKSLLEIIKAPEVEMAQVARIGDRLRNYLAQR